MSRSWIAVISSLALACTGELGTDRMDGGFRRENDAARRDAARRDAGTDVREEDGGAPPFDAGPPLEPGDPGPSDVAFDVRTTEDVRSISRWIYGINGGGEGADHPEAFTFFRSGGNRLTAYNWENNASNAGSDWLHQNDGYLGGGDTPGEVPRSFVASVSDRGAAVVTVPMIGYVAADKRGDGDVSDSPDYLSTRFRISRARKGSGLSDTPDGSDAYVNQDEFVAFMEERFAGLRSTENSGLFYSLDNEPDLWTSTHARLRGGDGSTALTYEELIDRTMEYGSMIRELAPGATIFGPVSYGYYGYIRLQDAPDAGGRDFLDTYMDALRAEEARSGVRVVDVLDLHWYPEIDVDGVPIESDSNDADVAEWRMQAPRSLWDGAFEEPGWIARDVIGGPVRLIPRLRDQIAAHYPGMRLAFTEYYYGGGDHISGGIAQADVLGIFGREGVFAANLWHLGETDDRFIHAAFEMYRRLDGSGARFGDTSVHASTTGVEETSVYASIDSEHPGRVVIVAINKTAGALRAGIRVAHPALLASARVFVLDESAAEPRAAGELEPAALNAYAYEMPAHSVSALVIDP
jgi:hypothetical protein